MRLLSEPAGDRHGTTNPRPHPRPDRRPAGCRGNHVHLLHTAEAAPDSPGLGGPHCRRPHDRDYSVLHCVGTFPERSGPRRTAVRGRKFRRFTKDNASHQTVVENAPALNSHPVTPTALRISPINCSTLNGLNNTAARPSWLARTMEWLGS